MNSFLLVFVAILFAQIVAVVFRETVWVRFTGWYFRRSMAATMKDYTGQRINPVPMPPPLHACSECGAKHYEAPKLCKCSCGSKHVHGQDGLMVGLGPDCSC